MALPSPGARATGVVVLVFTALMVVLAVPASATLPLDVPADTYQVNGRVRSLVVIGSTVWRGGVFSEVQTGKNLKVADVVDLAAFHRVSGAPADATPLALGGVDGAEVWKLAVSGSTVYAAGRFTLVVDGKTYSNLVAFDGATGDIRPEFHPVGVTPRQAVTVSDGVVYAAGSSLQAFDASSGAPVPGFSTSSVQVNASLRGHKISAQYRELLMVNGWLYAACQCDSITQGGTTRAVTALIRFNPATGSLDRSFVAEGVGVTAFGISIATDGSDIYLGAGGSDFVARYAPGTAHGSGLVGAQVWKRDTSGSAQAIAVSYGDVVVGGHFVEIADETGDNCGFRSSTDPTKLDPDDMCITRNRLAAYTLDGTLQSWDPSVTGNYNGVWSVALDGPSIHIGGEFRRVHGVRQTYYARLD
jgi:hypothetical protein